MDGDMDEQSDFDLFTVGRRAGGTCYGYECRPRQCDYDCICDADQFQNRRGACNPCTKKFPNCSSCSRTMCETCEEGYSLVDGVCTLMMECPDGTFNTGTACAPCDNNCDTCSGSANNCTSCDFVNFGGKAPENGTCLCGNDLVWNGTGCIGCDDN